MAQSIDPHAPEQSGQWSEQAQDLGRRVSEQAQDLGRRASEQAQDMGRRAADSATDAATVTRDFIKEHPAATAAAIGGLAFAIGALWMVGRSRQSQSSLLGRLGDLQSELPRRWRI